MDKPFKPIDQFAHWISCLFLTVLSPLIIVTPILWAITREYYQTKARMVKVYAAQDIELKPGFVDVMKNTSLFSRDLVFSYIGVACGAAILVFILFYWVLGAMLPHG